MTMQRFVLLVVGLATERAVREFQQGHGLPDDGIAGPATRNALP